MTGAPVAPCNGQGELFDSIDEHAHAVAAKLCATCPLIAACGLLLKKTAYEYGTGPHGVHGTWAGRLVGAGPVPRGRKLSAEHEDRIAREEETYGQEAAREAHNAYTAGDRSAWAVAGERTYKRRQRRLLREGNAA